MMKAHEFQTLFLTEDGEVTLPDSSCVDVGEDIVDHKTVHNSNVYKCGDQFFEVTWYRSNTGYWGDSEREAPEVCEVEPHVVTKTEYRLKKVQKQDAS
ncbi:MAG: hypothetical protein WAV48_04830 [Candidatus Magasanikiibacteriota bacterium]